MGPLAIPLISAGANLLGQAWNAITQRRTNKKNEEFSREMYDLQREDALEDWERQAAYNSPEQQMERLRQAGLNPNLVYGKGADNTMASVRSSSNQAVNRVAPRINFDEVGGQLSRYYEIKRTQAQTDNLAEQNALYQKEGLLKSAQTAETLEKTARTKEETERLRKLTDLIVEKTRVDIEGGKVNNLYILDKNQREELINSQNIKESIQRILLMKAQEAKTDAERTNIMADYDRVKASVEIAQLDVQLRRMGINPNDPAWLRMIMQNLQSPKSSEAIREELRNSFRLKGNPNDPHAPYWQKWIN